MSRSPSPSASMHSAQQDAAQLDDLTQITGIGPVTQTRLREWLNVRTYADLAALSTEAIESCFRDAGKPVARLSVQEWIVQAQALAPTLLGEWTAQTRYELAVERRWINGQEHYRTVVRGSDENESEIWEGTCIQTALLWMAWQLGVTLQTGDSNESETPDPCETCEAEAIEQDEAPRPPARAMEEHETNAGLDGEPKTESATLIMELASSESDATETSRALVGRSPLIPEILQIQLVPHGGRGAVLVADRQNRQFNDVLRANTPFALHIAFRLTGMTNDTPDSRQLVGQAEVFAHHRVSGAVVALGKSQPTLLREKGDRYTTTLPDGLIEDAGAYRLKILMRLVGASSVLGYLEVPVLQVGV